MPLTELSATLSYAQFAKGYTSVRYFMAPILKSLLFRSYLCINGKVLEKKNFDWPTIRGDRIIPRILSGPGLPNPF